jgi:hypothetical protein
MTRRMIKNPASAPPCLLSPETPQVSARTLKLHPYAAADAEVIPSRPRRARHRIEQTCSYYLDAQPDAAIATMAQAYAAALETIRYNGTPSAFCWRKPSRPIRAGGAGRVTWPSGSACPAPDDTLCRIAGRGAQTVLSP